MDDKLVYFLLIILGSIVGSFLLMRKTAKGKKTFFIILSVLFTLNMTHLIYVKNLEKTGPYSGLGPAVGYAIATVLAAALLLLISVVWKLSVSRKK